MRQGRAHCIIGNDVTNSGRILDEQALLALFSDNEQPNSSITDGENDAASIPDLHARVELEAFERNHECMRWPEPGAGVAEGAFNDTVLYWLRRAE